MRRIILVALVAAIMAIVGGIASPASAEAFVNERDCNRTLLGGTYRAPDRDVKRVWDWFESAKGWNIVYARPANIAAFPSIWNIYIWWSYGRANGTVQHVLFRCWDPDGAYYDTNIRWQ